MAEISRRGRPCRSPSDCLQNDLRARPLAHAASTLRRRGQPRRAPGSSPRWPAGRRRVLVRLRVDLPPVHVPHRPTRRSPTCPLAERLARACATPRCAPRSSTSALELGGIGRFLFADLDKLFPLGDPPDYEPAPEQSVGGHRRARGPHPAGGRLRPDARATTAASCSTCRSSATPTATSTPSTRCCVTPRTVLGLGDGGAHCGVLCDASLPTFMLTHWARDRDRGDRLAARAGRCTTRPARTAALYGFDDRGLLAPGYLRRRQRHRLRRPGARRRPRWSTTCRPAAGA